MREREGRREGERERVRERGREGGREGGRERDVHYTCTVTCQVQVKTDLLLGQIHHHLSRYYPLSHLYKLRASHIHPLTHNILYTCTACMKNTVMVGPDKPVIPGQRLF